MAVQAARLVTNFRTTSNTWKENSRHSNQMKRSFKNDAIKGSDMSSECP